MLTFLFQILICHVYPGAPKDENLLTNLVQSSQGKAGRWAPVGAGAAHRSRRRQGGGGRLAVQLGAQRGRRGCLCLYVRRQRLSLQHISSKQSVFFVWELKWTREPPPSLSCQFSVGFAPASEGQLSIPLKPYTYEFQVENFFVSIVLFVVGV